MTVFGLARLRQLPLLGVYFRLGGKSAHAGRLSHDGLVAACCDLIEGQSFPWWVAR
jgi:hypothetical protein